MVNIQDVLIDAIKVRQQKNPRFSLRAWARQLGYKNPSLLSDVLSGRRRPSQTMLSAIAANLGLSEAEEAKLHDLNRKPSKGTRPTALNNLALDQFRLIADWYYLVILELFLLKDFEATTKQVTQRLMRSIPASFAQMALGRLERLGLIAKDARGKWQRTATAQNLFVGLNIPDAAIRQHHHEMLDLALEALEHQDVQQRDISGSTVAIRTQDLPQLRKAIYQLHATFNQLSAKPRQGDAVYRLNVQLFRIDRDIT
jgi:uncharacterized protein (TIGR02147 family)